MKMDNTKLRERAISLAKCLGNAAASLVLEDSDRDAQLFLGWIAGGLYIVHKNLGVIDFPSEKLPRHKLEQFISLLEEICKWKPRLKNPYRNRSALCGHNLPIFPALMASSSSNYSSSQPSDLELSDAQDQAKCVVWELAHEGQKLRDQFCTRLKHFLPSSDAPEQPVGQTRQPEDYPSEVNHRLYTILEHQWSCTCETSDDAGLNSRRHAGRLRLRERLQRVGNDVLFDTAFSATSAVPQSGKHQWQQMKFQISSSSKRVRFPDETIPTSEDTTLGIETHCIPRPPKTLCELLEWGPRQVGECCLRLKPTNDNLLEVSRVDPLDPSIQPGLCISLADSLKRQQVTPSAKISLAYIIARSVWQFYNSDWMCARWSTETIRFIPESCPQGALLNHDKPYFAINFDNVDKKIQNEFYDGDGLVWHHYPRILALGVMLVELFSQESTGSYHNTTAHLNKRINDGANRGLIELKDPYWPELPFLNPAIKNTIRKVIKVCFGEDEFKIQSQDGNIDSSDSCVEGRRALLFEHVVSPLETLHKGIKTAQEKVLSERETFESGIGPRTILAGGKYMREPLEQSSQFLNRSEGIFDSILIAKAPLDVMPGTQDHRQGIHRRDCVLFDDSWFDKNASKAEAAKSWIAKLQRKWKILKELGSGSRVKIAILDTGVDLGHPNIQANQERIKKTWTLDHDEEIPAASHIRDDHGHGTYIADLLLRVAPQADIFVAQAIKTDIDPTKLKETTQQIAKALRHAVQNWEVDIVSISFGFDEIYTDLESEILSAKDRCLIFAAASNYGGNKSIAFPAKVEGVICIHSARSDGTPSGFTPDPITECVNFSTLGEHIESAWVGSSEVAVKSGTSYATPIAVAFAAFLLEFGRRNISDRNILQRLKRSEYMKQVFTLVCGNRKSGGYYYLNPSEFFRPRRSEWTEKEDGELMRLSIEKMLL